MHLNENHDKVADKSKKGKMYSWIGLVGGFWPHVTPSLKINCMGQQLIYTNYVEKKLFLFNVFFIHVVIKRCMFKTFSVK